MDTLALRRLDSLIWMTIALVATIVLAATGGERFPDRVAHLRGAGPRMPRPELGLLVLPPLAGRPASGLGTELDRPNDRLCRRRRSPFVSRRKRKSAASGSRVRRDRSRARVGLARPARLDELSVRHAPAVPVPYLSFTVQATTTVLVLAFSNRLLQLRTFMLAFMLSAIVCIAISAIVPAEGAWGFYGLTPADYPAIVPATRELHLPIFHGLRDGSLRTFTGMTSEGIITFPSFHAALSIIFMVGLWPVPVLRWIGAVVNGLMIIVHADRRRPLLHRCFRRHRHRGDLPDRGAPHHASGPTERVRDRGHGSQCGFVGTRDTKPAAGEWTSDETCRVRAQIQILGDCGAFRL